VLARDVKRVHVEQLAAKLCKTASARQPKGESLPPKPISPRMVARALQLLGAAFKYGLSHEWVQRNPVAGVARPTGVPSVRPDPFTEDELGLLITHCDARWRLPIEFAAYTGLRIGELVALRWADVDWNAREANATGDEISAPKSA
jgi:integrase